MARSRQRKFALYLEILEHPDPFVVRLAGEVDIENADLVVALATHSWNGHGAVIFDLAGLTSWAEPAFVRS
jgi:anti-anti-sigma regulatory factor